MKRKMFTRFFKNKTDYIPENPCVYAKAAIPMQQLITSRWHQVAPHMTYLPQIYFITNYVTTSLNIYILLQQKHKRQQQKEEKGNIHKKGEVIRRFFKLIEQKVLNDNKVFLLIDLLGDISDLNKEKGLEPVATSTKSLQRIIETNFKENSSFQIVGRRLMTYSSDVNTHICFTVTLKECELCDKDLTQTFGKVVLKKIPKSRQKWALSAEVC